MTPEMITIDCADPQALAAWWAKALDVKETKDYDDFVVLSATPLVIGFQRVPEPKAVKNRVHVDFTSADRAADVERLVKLGASVVSEQTMKGLTWTILKDPEGNEFCVEGGEH